MNYYIEFNIELDVEYYEPGYFSTIDNRYDLSLKDVEILTKESKKSINKTDEKIIIQNDIYKYQPIYLFDKMLHYFGKEYNCDIEIFSIKWNNNEIKSTKPKDEKLPGVNIILKSKIQIDKSNLIQFMHYDSFLDNNKYLKGENNGWTWYTIDYKYEYARTRMLKMHNIKEYTK